MRASIMQPYIFPYLGYFQLIKSVDYFIFFDDVNFIKKGWINRNRILLNGKEYLFSIPLTKISQNKIINETYLTDYDGWRNDFLKLIKTCYLKSPNFNKGLELIENVLKNNYETISELAIDTVKEFSKYLEINSKFYKSSELDYSRSAKGPGKILSILSNLEINNYVNPIGGKNLYDKVSFEKHGKSLRFLKMNSDIFYKQGNLESFIPNLSIIDSVMWNSKESLLNKISKFTIVH